MDIRNSRYNNMWKLLRNCCFDIDFHLHPDLLCTICNKLLENAHQNVCGCRYCLKCITLFSEFNDKCPGSSYECKESMVDLSKNIQIDHVANRKVSELVVKCPEKSCEFKDELRNMFDHMKVHNRSCPYAEIGCNQNALSDNTYENSYDHLIRESFSHPRLVVEAIMAMKQEIEDLKSAKKMNELMVEENCTKQRQQREEIDNIHAEMIKWKRSIEEKCSSSVTRMESANSKFVKEMKYRFADTVKRIESRVWNVRADRRCYKSPPDESKDSQREAKNKTERSKILSKSITMNKTITESTVISTVTSNEKVVDELKSLKHQSDKIEDVHHLRKDVDRYRFELNSRIDRLVSELKMIDTVRNRLSRMENEFRQWKQPEIESERATSTTQRPEVKDQSITPNGNIGCKMTSTILEEKNVRKSTNGNLLTVDHSKIMQRQEELAKEISAMIIQILEMKKEFASFKSNLAIEKSQNRRGSDLMISPSLYTQSSYEWRVTEFSKKLANAKSGNNTYLISEWFILSGYKMTLKMYPNGDEHFLGTHLSVFGFIVCWVNKVVLPPATCSVVISILDQVKHQSHICREFNYSPIKEEDNDSIDVKELGASDFCNLNFLMSESNYVAMDCLILQVSIKI